MTRYRLLLVSVFALAAILGSTLGALGVEPPGISSYTVSASTGDAPLRAALDARAGEQPDIHRGLGDGASALPERAELALEEANERIARAQTSGSDVVRDTLASASQRGCTTKLLPLNFSSRNGARPAMFVLHFTVSRNVAGWSDVNAIYSWFSQSRAQASSNYIIDFEGHCLLTVPESAKAWTQGFFNPWAISIEFIAMGSESTAQWKSPGLVKGARVVADSLKRWGIPLRRVNPDGCTVKAGITDHDALECGNVHWDVGPNFPWSYFLGKVRWYYGPRYRFELRDGGEVLARSAQTLGGSMEKRVLRAFLADREDTLIERVRAGDHDILLDRVRVCC